MVIDRALLRILKAEINTEIEKVGQKYGISLRVGNGNYTPETFTLKLEGGVIVNGIAIDKDRQAFKANALYVGLAPNDLGREFNFQGKVYKIVGLKTSSKKYPVIASNLATGKKFKFAVADVKALLK